MTAVCTQVLANNSGYHSSTRALAEGMARFETSPEQIHINSQYTDSNASEWRKQAKNDRNLNYCAK
jgi:hypothetical protein